MTFSPTDLAKIRQLSDTDLAALQAAVAGADHVELPAGDVLSLLNEVQYHRSRKVGYCLVESLVSMRDQKPYVRITIGGAEMQLAIADAYDHARKIVQVAAGASADAFLYNFMVEHVGMEKDTLGPLMHAFRNYRERELDDHNVDPPAGLTRLSDDVTGEREN